MDLKKNMSFISRSMVLKHLVCAACALSFQTKVEVSKSFKMLSFQKEEMLVFLLLLVHCLLSGPLNWSERKLSGLFGVMDKGGRTEISEYEKVRLVSKEASQQIFVCSGISETQVFREL